MLMIAEIHNASAQTGILTRMPRPLLRSRGRCGVLPHYPAGSAVIFSLYKGFSSGSPLRMMVMSLFARDDLVISIVERDA
jgi:hypothetical protein